MHAGLNACMRKTFGCMYQILGACIWKRLGACMRLLGASLWRGLGACLCLLSHPITVSQCYVMDEDAALEAQAPEGSSPEGELTGKPYSSNSIAGTNFGVMLAPFWTNSAPFCANLEPFSATQSALAPLGQAKRRVFMLNGSCANRLS